MKKLLSCFLTAILLLTLFIPALVQADAMGLNDQHTYMGQTPILSIEGAFVPFSSLDGISVSDDVYGTVTDTVYGSVYFTVYCDIDYASNIYAEDITIGYDENLFEYIDAETIGGDQTIYHEGPAVAGSVRYILASNGEQYGINGHERLLAITFRSRNLNGTGEIKVESGVVANHLGEETSCICRGISIRTYAIDADVNGDGRISIGDVAITAFNLTKPTGSWTNPRVDVDSNGRVDDYDLRLIVQRILAN